MSLDIIVELLGHKPVSMIQNRTLEEATLQGDKEFQTSIEKLHSLVSALFVV